MLVNCIINAAGVRFSQGEGSESGQCVESQKATKEKAEKDSNTPQTLENWGEKKVAVRGFDP